MGIRGDGIGVVRLRALVASTLIVAFLLRAIIPVGYMPDFGAAARGVFKVVICTASGSKMVPFDGETQKDPKGHPDKHDQPCAFSGLGAVAFLTLGNEAPLPPDFVTPVLIPHLAVSLPPARAGPPLGSRGPPQLS